MNTILLLLLASSPINYDGVGKEFGIWPKRPELRLPIKQEAEVMLIKTASVDTVAAFFGADIKQSGDMIPKNRVISGDIIMEATEDEHGKYLIAYEAICKPIDDEIFSFGMEIYPNPDTVQVIKYLDKRDLIWQK